MAGLSAEESVILIITLVIVVLASIKAIRVSNRLCTGVHCGDLPSHVGTQGDKQRLRINELEEAEADYERITTLQMAQNRRQQAELEKARDLLKEVVEIARDNTLECYNEHMQNYGPSENMIQRNIDTSDQLHKEMNRIDEIASYLGDKT